MMQFGKLTSSSTGVIIKVRLRLRNYDKLVLANAGIGAVKAFWKNRTVTQAYTGSLIIMVKVKKKGVDILKLGTINHYIKDSLKMKISLMTEPGEKIWKLGFP